MIQTFRIMHSDPLKIANHGQVNDEVQCLLITEKFLITRINTFNNILFSGYVNKKNRELMVFNIFQLLSLYILTLMCQNIACQKC